MFLRFSYFSVPVVALSSPNSFILRSSPTSKTSSSDLFPSATELVSHLSIFKSAVLSAEFVPIFSSAYSSLDYTTTSGSSKIRNYDADYTKEEEFKVSAILGSFFPAFSTFSDSILLSSVSQLSIVSPVADIILDLLNATYTQDENSTLDLWGIDPLWREIDDEGVEQIVNWAGFWRYVFPPWKLQSPVERVGGLFRELGSIPDFLSSLPLLFCLIPF